MKIIQYSCFLVLLLLCASAQVTASEPTPIPPYSKKYGGGIQNPRKKSAFWFTSVTQSLRGVPQFRRYCKKGKSNPIKKKLNSFFSRIESKRVIKGNETKKAIQFFQKQAKKSKVTLPSGPFIFANFLLEKSGMPHFSYVKSVALTRKPAGLSLNALPMFTIDYPVNNVRMVTILIPGGRENNYMLHYKNRPRDKELKELLREVCLQDQTFNPHELGNLSNNLGLVLPQEIKEHINSNYRWDTFQYKIATRFEFSSEEQVPRLLPIYLNRWTSLNLTRKNPKKKGYHYSTQRIKPSNIIEIPLANNPTKIARYKLISMVINRFENVETSKHPDRQYFHAYSVVLTKKGNKKIWAVYDDEHVHKIRNLKKRYIGFKIFPQERQKIHKDIRQGATLFFYQFAGFKNRQPPPLQN